MILGVDPGLHGAFGIVDGSKVVAVVDTPTKIRNQVNEIDIYEVGKFLSPYSDFIKLAVVEEVGVMSGKEGRVSLFNFGKNAGIIHGALGVLGVPIFFVKPAIWKMVMGLSSDKNQSLDMASKLFPDSKHLWSLKKHDGRAEAVLLAWFGVDRFS